MKRLLISTAVFAMLGLGACSNVEKESAKNTEKEVSKKASIEVTKEIAKQSEEKTDIKIATKAPSKEQAMKIMKSSDCLACHTEKNKVVGPSFMEIAEKYKGDKEAPAALVKKVKDGGKGVWGPMPMTAHKNMKESDIQVTVDWILSLK